MGKFKPEELALIRSNFEKVLGRPLRTIEQIEKEREEGPLFLADVATDVGNFWYNILRHGETETDHVRGHRPRERGTSSRYPA